MADGQINNVTTAIFPDSRRINSVYRQYACEEPRTSPRYYAEKGRIIGATRKYRFPWYKPDDGSEMIPWAMGHAVGYVDADGSRFPPDCDRTLKYLYCTSVGIEPVAPKSATLERAPVYHYFWATLKYEDVPYFVVDVDGTLFNNYYSAVAKPSTQTNLSYNGSFKFKDGPLIFSGVPSLTCQREYLITQHEMSLRALDKTAIAAKLGRVNNDTLTITTPTERISQQPNQVLFAGVDYSRCHTNIRGEFVSDVQYRLLVRDGRDGDELDGLGQPKLGTILDFDHLIDKSGKSREIVRVDANGADTGQHIYNKTKLQTLFPT